MNQEGWQLSGPRREVDEKALKRLRARFRKMMGALFQEQGATLRIEILEDPAVQEFIGTHAGILDSAFQEERMSDSLQDRLRESDWMFSGYKTFHELNEAFPSLVDENGVRKPFNQFLKDVQSIDETYNRNWLRAEYNFAGASAQMAAKWERYAEDGDDYYLQYRTANDGAVRPEHAALHGVTLPQSDSFWDTYYPPNGWNCRCTVVQVRKSKYEQTPHDEAMAKGAAALAKDTKGMFRFNPGKQQSAFPAYNPYTISRCSACDKSKLHLAANIPNNQLCSACVVIQTMVKKESSSGLSGQDRSAIRQSVKEWADTHLPETTLPNGQKAHRLVIANNGEKLVVNKSFFTETFAKNIRNKRLAETMDIALKVGSWLPSASFVGIETGNHHPCGFWVYEADIDGVRVQCKVKDQKEKMVYTMRIL